jgi:hypothetical protein
MVGVNGDGGYDTLQRQFRLYIHFLGIARPQPQLPHSCVCERFIYSQDQSTYFLQQKRQTHRGNICIIRSQTHECGNRDWDPAPPIFLFWEHLFQIFGILSLQCRYIIAASKEVVVALPPSPVAVQRCRCMVFRVRPWSGSVIISLTVNNLSYICHIW